MLCRFLSGRRRLAYGHAPYEGEIMMRRLFGGRLGTAAMLSLFLAALVLLCLTADSLELTFGWRTDFSFNELTTPSLSTRDMLGEITAPVHIYAVFKHGNEDMRLFELLNRYSAMCADLTWEQVDLALYPSLVPRFQTHGGQSVKEESVIVYCPSTDRFRVLQSVDFVAVSYQVLLESYQISLNYEKKLSEAILYVTRDVIYEAAILQGHHELDANTLGYFTSVLSANHYDVSFINLLNGDTLHEGALLMILSPSRDLQPSELDLLTEFIADGGAVFITLDPGDPTEHMPRFLSLLRLYGFVPLPGMVVADLNERGTYANGYPYVLIPELIPTAITAPLIASAQDELWLVMARAFQTPGETDRDLYLETIALSGDHAYLAELTRYPLEPRTDDLTGPFPLALAASRLMPSTRLSRGFIIGNSVLLTDANLYASTDCGAFILSVVQYLLDQSLLSLAIDPKPYVRPGLSPSANGPGTWLVVLIPLLVLIAALIVLAPKRYR
jgi:hypothetical protein